MVATHKSSEKRAKQDIKKTLVNKMNVSKSKTTVKKVRDAITTGDKKSAAEFLSAAQADLRKLAKTGVIKKKTAARKTSRLATQINKLK
jgi:small subunit ribosomal protein S20